MPAGAFKYLRKVLAPGTKRGFRYVYGVPRVVGGAAVARSSATNVYPGRAVRLREIYRPGPRGGVVGAKAIRTEGALGRGGKVVTARGGLFGPARVPGRTERAFTPTRSSARRVLRLFRGTVLR